MLYLIGILQDDPKVNFTFTPLEYDNYDVDQFGNLDLTKPKPRPPKQQSGQESILVTLFYPKSIIQAFFKVDKANNYIYIHYLK